MWIPLLNKTVEIMQIRFNLCHTFLYTYTTVDCEVKINKVY